MQKENSIFGGTTFWMLNDKLEDEEIKFQIKEFHSKGIYAFIARTYIGLKSDYPGEEFMDKMKLIIETAEQYGIKVLLQARYMPEAIPDLEPQNALNFLRADKGDVPDNCTLLLSKDGINYSHFNSETFLDMFDEDAVEQYIQICYGIWDRFKEHFGKTVISVWVDEPSYSAEFLPYPQKLEDEFLARYGYSLRDNLHLLYCDQDNYKTVRWQYRTLLQDMMERSYFAKIKEWCNRNNLWFSGHLMLEETIKSQLLRSCATMPFYSYFDLPGMDVLLGQMNWRENEIRPPEINEVHASKPVTLTTALQLASASAQAGKKHMLCEMYGVSSQNLSFRDQKFMFDTYACHGINHRAIHGSFYSLAGRRKRAYPPHINYYQPYWDEFDKMTEGVINTAAFVTEGKRSAKILVIHPMGSGAALFPGKIDGCDRSKSDKATEMLDSKFVDLLSRLTASHIQFDLGDERIIERDGKVEGNKIIVGECEYDTVVMPYLTHIRQSTANTISKFVANGGKIYALESLPHYADGCEFNFKTNIETFDTSSKLITRLKSCCDFKLLGPDSHNIRVMKRNVENGANYFLLNFNCASECNVVLRSKGEYAAFLTNCVSGETTQIHSLKSNGFTETELHLEPGGSLMLSLKESKTEVQKSLPQATITLPLADSWSVKQNNPNVMLLEFCRYKKGDKDFSINMPVLAVQDVLVAENYNGKVTLEFEFESLVEIQNAKLALENAENYNIYLNGAVVNNQPMGYYLATQFKTVLLPQIKQGINVITLVKNDYVPLARAKKAINSLFEHQKGDELESCYLIGEFSVKADSEPCLTGNKRYSGFVLDNKSDSAYSEVTCCGYPFYAGKIQLTQTVNINNDTAEKITLKFDDVTAACARIFVNQKDCGIMMWNPYECDITPFVKNGDNTITVEISSSLRNLLGPYHRPHGEIGNLFGGSYANPNLAWNGTDKQISDPKWYEHRFPDTPLWCESYMQTKLGVIGGRIIIE